MTRVRVAAAAAAMLTALLLQATVVGPATYPWPVSLPAMLVAAVALCEGPATGMSFGFSIGLLADLGSRHPAGLLALVWLGIGVLCGVLAGHRGVLRDAVVVAAVCAVAGPAVSLALGALDGGAPLRAAADAVLPTLAVSALLAVAVVPLVRSMLRSEAMRARRPFGAQLPLGAGRD